MRRSEDTPWEVWGMVLGIIALVAIPAITGILIFKLYRKYKPLEEPKAVSLVSLTEVPGDSFYKKFFVGWIVCGPIFYLLYLYFYPY